MACFAVKWKDPRTNEEIMMARNASLAIDRELEKVKTVNKETVFKMLMLGMSAFLSILQSTCMIICLTWKGTANAGKTTFVKQMKAVNGIKLTNLSNEEIVAIMIKNIFDSMRKMFVAAPDLSDGLSDECKVLSHA